MKTIVKTTIAFVIAVSVLASTVLLCSAETYYVYNNLKYRDVDFTANTIAFCGSTDETEQLLVPDIIGVKTVVEIDSYAFYNNTTLKEIDFSATQHLVKIGASAFYGCSSLQSVVIPETVEYLSDFTFTECSSLKSLVMNNSPKIIPEEMCNYCASLDSCILPESVEEISRFAFANCSALSYVEIPKGVEKIAKSAFRNDPNLTLGVYYGSVGYEYAREMDIPYVLLDVALLGDANGDGYVNVNDVTAIQRHAAELELLEGINFHAADINGDGNVSVDDATELQRFLAEYVVDYPIGEVMTQ